MSTLENIFLGPYDDLRRFITGVTSAAPPTRVKSEKGLNQARRYLTNKNCDLSGCTVENLHTFPVNIAPEQLFKILTVWKQWPRSGFFACRSTDKRGSAWFSYRWWKLIPIVMMELKVNEPSQSMIYDIRYGIGAGGYHSFLINQVDLPPVFDLYKGQTSLSIFTTFPPMRIMPFQEGLHDQVNYDTYRKLRKQVV